MYRLYAKAKDQKKYQAMDYQAGVQVSNLIYATVFPEEKLSTLKEVTADLNDHHQGEYKFEIRKVRNINEYN